MLKASLLLMTEALKMLQQVGGIYLFQSSVFPFDPMDESSHLLRKDKT